MNESAARKIVPFPDSLTDAWPENMWPESMSGSSFMTYLVERIVTRSDFADAVRSLVEGYAVQYTTRAHEQFRQRIASNNPARLADQEPDRVSKSDSRTLWNASSKVKDLSLGLELFDNE